MTASGTMRPRWREGQVLTAADLRDEQQDRLQRLRRHELTAHAPGIVRGLQASLPERVGLKPAGKRRLVVAPGVAVDDSGRKLLLDRPLDYLLPEAAPAGYCGFDIWLFGKETCFPSHPRKPPCQPVPDRINDQIALCPTLAAAGPPCPPAGKNAVFICRLVAKGGWTLLPEPCPTLLGEILDCLELRIDPDGLVEVSRGRAVDSAGCCLELHEPLSFDVSQGDFWLRTVFDEVCLQETVEPVVMSFPSEQFQPKPLQQGPGVFLGRIIQYPETGRTELLPPSFFKTGALRQSVAAATVTAPDGLVRAGFGDRVEGGRPFRVELRDRVEEPWRHPVEITPGGACFTGDVAFEGGVTLKDPCPPPRSRQPEDGDGAGEPGGGSLEFPTAIPQPEAARPWQIYHTVTDSGDRVLRFEPAHPDEETVLKPFRFTVGHHDVAQEGFHPDLIVSSDGCIEICGDLVINGLLVESPTELDPLDPNFINLLEELVRQGVITREKLALLNFIKGR